ncbi:methionyl-tRNA formyltransferase [Candidatus Spongiihabitans sp.]|uniref:methionyl-tRNA formyltransferase n=1 Tax=Candidatus Spongiihabitans sp. TaxID=3101308 RepID=UPI003C7E249D
MRIVVHGQQAFGKAVLERLLARNENIVAVCAAPQRQGVSSATVQADPLVECARQNGLAVHQPVSWKTDESLALMQSFDADLCMMAYVLLLVPQAVLNAPRLGSFQYHPSLLPMHRGPSAINWPIAMGAAKTGLSIFWPDDGLDQGPILLQKECEIGTDETLGDVYFKKLFPMGVDAMIESLDLVKRGQAPKIAQDLSTGSYESWFGRSDAKINWAKPAAQIYNMIRAGNPQPGAWTTHGRQELKVFDSCLAEADGHKRIPGEILSVDEHGFVVAAGEGAIKVKRVRADGGKIGAAEYAATSGLAVGDILDRRKDHTHCALPTKNTDE